MKVLAILEHQYGRLHRMSWETLAAAQQIATLLGAEVDASVIGSGIIELAKETAAKKAARVYAVEHALLEHYTADGYTASAEALIRKVKPDLVLFPHTYQTRDFAPKLAARFERSLISDAVAARVENRSPVFVRQFFQGKLNGDIRPDGSGRCLVRAIFASTSRSSHMLSALAPPTMSAVPIRAMVSVQRSALGPDMPAPAAPVRSTKQVTRGFVSETMSAALRVQRSFDRSAVAFAATR